MKRGIVQLALVAMVMATAAGANTSSAQPNASWSGAGSMSIDRISFQAVTLPSGKVLVAGGLANQNTAVTASADLYDPATGSWTPTGSMHDARGGFPATLLKDGRVLVAGGFGASTYFLASAEIYDPATGIWNTTGSLHTGRQQHSAILLPNGKVLVTGGNTSRECAEFCATTTAGSELFNPATGTWSKVGSMTIPRAFFTLTRLTDGKVLAAGGRIEVGNNVYSSIAYADLYDPASKKWSATGAIGTSRSNHSATRLPDGRVLVAGGWTGGPGSLNSIDTAEVYDPVTGAWSATGSMSTIRERHVAFLLAAGQVLVAGGDNDSDCCFDALSSAELYDPGNCGKPNSLCRRQ